MTLSIYTIYRCSLSIGIALMIQSHLASGDSSQQSNSFDDLFPNVLPNHSNTSPQRINQDHRRLNSKAPANATLPSLQKQYLQGAQNAVYWRYQLTGDTIIPKEILEAMVKPYLHHPITPQHHLRLQNQLTHYYIQRGFINSGVLVTAGSDINNNSSSDNTGILQLTPINGRINTISINNNGRLNDSLIKQKLTKSIKERLDIHELEKQLYLLKKSRLIDTIDAKLLPGEKIGESTLAINVKEARPYGLHTGLNNYSPEVAGAGVFSLGFNHYNLLGYSDSANLFYQRSRDRSSYGGYYQWPLRWHDSHIQFAGYRSETSPKSARLIDLDIENNGYQWTWTIPFQQHLNSKQHAAIRFEKKKNRTLIGAIDDDTTSYSRVRLLRIEHLWQQQGLKHATTLRSQFSHSLSASSSETRPEKHFSSLNIQGQSIHRLPWWDSHLSIKGQWQYTEDTLFGFEQLSLSGIHAVRGYPESSVSVDQGLLGSLEWQLPIYRSPTLGYTIVTGPFLDAGYGKNHLEDRHEHISSIGLAVNIQWEHYGRLSLHGAKPLTTTAETEGRLQDEGIHLGLSLSF